MSVIGCFCCCYLRGLVLDGNCGRYRSGGELELSKTRTTSQRGRNHAVSVGTENDGCASRECDGRYIELAANEQACHYQEHKAQYCNYKVAPKRYEKSRYLRPWLELYPIFLQLLSQEHIWKHASVGALLSRSACSPTGHTLLHG